MSIAKISTPQNAELDGKEVQAASFVSVRLELRYRDTRIGGATGFIDISPTGPVLITNRHVLTGRHQHTGQPLDERNALVPDEVSISMRRRSDFTVVDHRVRLFDDSLLPRWAEHPELRERGDIASLPISDIEDYLLSPRPGYLDDLPASGPIILAPTTPVAVVGFPFGRHTAGFPVWTSGTIASEPGFDFDDLPVVLIDARTRAGQSGSPVLYHSHSGLVLTTSGPTMRSGSVSYFVGIYSGRISADSDLGMVWRPSAVARLIEHGVPSTALDPDKLRRGPGEVESTE